MPKDNQSKDDNETMICMSCGKPFYIARTPANQKAKIRRCLRCKSVEEISAKEEFSHRFIAGKGTRIVRGPGD